MFTFLFIFSCSLSTFSTRDSAAVEAVARVFAQRCLESGILEVYTEYTEEDREKEKVFGI